MFFRLYEKHLAVNQRKAFKFPPPEDNQGCKESEPMKGQFVWYEVKSSYVNMLNKHPLWPICKEIRAIALQFLSTTGRFCAM